MYTKLVGVLLLSCATLAVPNVSTAAYILHLKNGRQIITPAYWKEGRHVAFEVEGNGIARVYEDTVASIVSRSEPIAPAVPSAPASRATTPSASAERRSDQQKPLDVEAYRQKKDDLKREIDGAVEGYRDAAGAKDEEAKHSIRMQMTALAQKVFALEEDLKKQNGGVLPDGWQ